MSFKGKKSLGILYPDFKQKGLKMNLVLLRY